ncbi:RTX-I toxin determinant B [Gammaproteobacteria bacterium MOLA455]|nr:RTX-I toxin determinant B [Gammaproteobacteria bacterium MOLA455]
MNKIKSSSPDDMSAGTMPPGPLVSLLVRIAGLAGVAVPVHRFTYAEKNTDGVELARLDVVERAIELWKLRFPDGEAKIVNTQSVSKSDLPVLWLQKDGSDACIIRGIQNHGYLSEREDFSTNSMSLEELSNGVCLLLSVSDGSKSQAEKNNFSAKDWFIYAIRKRRKVFLEAVFGTFMLSIFGLMSALYTMQVYDRVVPTKGFSTLWVLTIGVLLAIFFEFLMKLVRAHMVDRASKVIDVELSSVFFGKALDIRAESRPRTVGTFAAQIRHFESVRNFMTSTTLFILADAPFALFFIFIIFLLAGPIAMVPLAVIPLGLLIGLAMKGPIERYTAEHMEESNKKNGLLIEAIDGIESVKAASAEWKIKDRWRDLTLKISDTELKSRMLTTISTSSAQSIQQLSYVGIIAAGAYAISSGNLTMGGLIACSIISGRALTPLAQIPNLVVQWKHAKIALDVLDGIMAMPGDQGVDRQVVPDRCVGQIKVADLTFAYEENAPTVEVGKLQLNPGDKIAVLGSVGSGKSTLIKLLSGLYRPQSGQVFLDGVEMQQLAVEFLREQIGYLPQEVRLFNGTLRDNLVLGLPVLSDSQILAAAVNTGLDRAIQSHPKGLDIMISEGGKGLSGGQRQLVGLTRLLLARPQVMLLDEPTASMDAQLEARVMDHLFSDVDDSAVVMLATHKIGALKHVNRIIVMEAGKIAIDGPKEKVIEHLNKQAANRKVT